MTGLRWVVAKNAISNLVRGGATAIVAIALPHFLAHSLDRDRFAAWSLVLQIAAYASVLDFGLQTAVARFIAQAIELKQNDRLHKLIETALAMLALAAALALAVIGVVRYNADSFFHGIPKPLLHEFQDALIVMAVGSAILLPLSTFTGVLIGMHKNEIPALAIGSSRLIGAIAAIVTAKFSNSLVLIAACVAIPNVIGGLIQLLAVTHLIAGGKKPGIGMDRAIAMDFLRFCAGLTVWSFGMLLISGLDVTIVGHFWFMAVGSYAIASTLMALFANANSSILSSLLAPFAAMQAKGDFGKMREIVLRSTRINTLLNFTATALVLAYGDTLLALWVGRDYALQTFTILVVLTITQAIRLSGSAYSIALIATGHQNRGIVPTVLEATTNLAISVWAVTRYGPIGVAYGSLFGAVIAIPCLLLYTVKFHDDLRVTRPDLAMRGMLFGIFPAMPMLAWSVLVRWKHLVPLQSLELGMVATAIGVFLAFDGEKRFATVEL